MAETFWHLYAILITLEVLRQYLEGRQAAVLANQFLYYSEGIPTARVAPDVMIVFGVAPGGRNNYKIWEEGQVPSVIFEITSPGTQAKDQVLKKGLYEQLGVAEYWLFDPKGEWIAEQLVGYRLTATLAPEDQPQAVYVQIADSCSTVLGLRLEVEGDLIGFYRLDNGDRLLIPSELAVQLRATAAELAQERLARDQAEQRAERAEQQAEQQRLWAEQLAQALRERGIDPQSLL